jgi:ParB-like chromosome segregation protein Spo0J
VEGTDDWEAPRFDLDCLPVVKLPVALLTTGNSPRLTGEDEEHIRSLAQFEDCLPPILVHEPTMRVIDGVHRLRAAQLNGEHEIDARMYSGDQASCFVLAVQANITHGLPLSLADRRAAAARMIELYPQWSNRAIASMSGLAAKTVGALRNRPTVDVHQLDARVGRDGRTRPIDPTERRRKAAELITSKPDASLREIAREAGISPETVRDVRLRMGANGSRPLHRRPDQASAAKTARVADEHQAPAARLTAIFRLQADPAVRSTERGRLMLRMLAPSQLIQQHGHQLIETLPTHCLPTVAEAARLCAHLWQELAADAERAAT